MKKRITAIMLISLLTITTFGACFSVSAQSAEAVVVSSNGSEAQTPDGGAQALGYKSVRFYVYDIIEGKSSPIRGANVVAVSAIITYDFIIPIVNFARTKSNGYTPYKTLFTLPYLVAVTKMGYNTDLLLVIPVVGDSGMTIEVGLEKKNNEAPPENPDDGDDILKLQSSRML